MQEMLMQLKKQRIEKLILAIQITFPYFFQEKNKGIFHFQLLNTTKSIYLLNEFVEKGLSTQAMELMFQKLIKF